MLKAFIRWLWPAAYPKAVTCKGCAHFDGIRCDLDKTIIRTKKSGPNWHITPANDCYDWTERND